MDQLIELQGTRVLLCALDGPVLGSERDASDFLSAAWAHEASLVAIPVERLDAGFFQLSSRKAGEIVQKFVNYRMTLAILGNIDGALANSRALRDFVFEANMGRSIWFVKDVAQLELKIDASKVG